MGKADRKLKRKRNPKPKSAITAQALAELQNLPEHLEAMIKANQELTDENERLKSAVGDILEGQANKIAALERRVATLEANAGVVEAKESQNEQPVHPSAT